MLKQRIITGLVMAPVALAAVFWLSSALFSVFAGFVIIVSAWEWANLAGFPRQTARFGYAAVLGGLCLFISIFSVPTIYLLIVAVCWWCLAFLMIRHYPLKSQYNPGRFLKLLIGMVVLIPAWKALVVLKSDFGALTIALVLAFVWASDIGAYFVGKRFGRCKLAENVSPKKTVEGLLGGVVLTVVVSIFVGLYLELSFGKGLLLMVLSVVIALASVIGDLLESLLKRERGIKDSSQLLPGHGGVLDRIDSLTAALPVFALMLIMSGS